MSDIEVSQAGSSRSSNETNVAPPVIESQSETTLAVPPAADEQPAAAAAGTAPEPFEIRKSSYPNGENPRLRYLKPYWWPYRTFVKQRYVFRAPQKPLGHSLYGRWIGRQLLEVISTEFRDRSVDYYVSPVAWLVGDFQLTGIAARARMRSDQVEWREGWPGIGSSRRRQAGVRPALAGDMNVLG